MAGTHSLLASAVTLTGSAVASTQAALVSGMYYHTLYLKYTPGQNANVLTVTIESSPQSDGIPDSSSDWYQDQIWTPSGGHYTGASQDIQLTGVNTTVQYKEFPFTTTAQKIRIKYSESTSTHGTITSELVSLSPS